MSKYILFFFISYSLFAQESDVEKFKHRLSYIDMAYEKRTVLYTFLIKKNGTDATENYVGEYLLSGKGEKMSLSNFSVYSEDKVPSEIERKISSIIEGVNFVAFTPYIKFVKKHLEAFDCEQLSENQWKLTAIKDKIEEIVNYSEEVEYHFIVTLNSVGEVTEIETFNSGDQKQNSYHVKTFYTKENNTYRWEKVQGQFYNKQSQNTLFFSLEMK